MWWDIRPHPDFGTVELRICDGIPTLREVSGLAALAQCLVHWLDTRIDAGDDMPIARDWTVRQNKWRAARYGIDASIIVDEEGRQQALSTSVLNLCDELAPVAADLRCADELGRVAEIVERGPSYARQRAVAAEGGGALEPVVDSLIADLSSHDLL